MLKVGTVLKTLISSAAASDLSCSAHLKTRQLVACLHKASDTFCAMMPPKNCKLLELLRNHLAELGLRGMKPVPELALSQTIQLS